MTPHEIKRSIQFQDAIGAVVDEYLRNLMPPDQIAEVLRDETKNIDQRAKELGVKP